MPHSILLATVVAGQPHGVISALVGLTAVMGGTGRYAAVLRRRTGPAVERATALGFFGGIIATCIVYIMP